MRRSEEKRQEKMKRKFITMVIITINGKFLGKKHSRQTSTVDTE